MSVTGPEDEEECIINMKTYGHIVSFEPNENSFCVPCPTPQGYFIIEGKKKVVVHQERKDSSQIVVLKEDDYFKCSIRRICSKTGPLGIGHIETLEIRGKMQGRFIKSVEMRLGSMIMFSETTSSSGQTKQKIWVSAHRFMDECVENWMNKVMQCSSDAMRMKTSLTELDILFDEERAGMAETTATEYVIDEIFFRECFSDCTKESRDWTVCFALAKVIETMIGVRLLDDIDELMFKRIMTPAHMIKHSLFFALSKEAELRSLTDRFRRGTWRTAYGSSVEGVSQSLSSRSELDELSHVRRISVPLDVHAANVSVRQIRKSQMGFICPCETPEGKEVGIVKYLSLTSFVTPDTSEKVVFGLSLLQNHLTKNDECDECDVTDKKFVFLNNVIVGCLDENALHPTSPQRHIHTRPFGHTRHTRHTRHTTRVGSRKALPEWLPTVVRNARKERKKNDALKFVSIYEDGEGHVHISSDSGRLCRPLVDEDGDIVYIDVAEQFYSILCAKNNTQVNVSKQVLSEIHPSLVFGVSASMIPFINHNQSPRAVFQSSMNKQALCTLTERLKWTEGEKKTVDYAQKPFCYTMSSSLVSSMNGINVYIAILSYTGYNQEDAIIVSKCAVDRGLFSNTRYDTIEIIENRLLEEKMIRHSPAYAKSLTKAYDDEGIILPKRKLKKGDIIAAKFKGNVLRKEELDETIEYTLAPDDCVVHSVEKTQERFSRIIRITFKKSKKLMIGDKLTSRHSQKGVVGRIVSTEDMPFDEHGSCPDLIINPHAIPSRMTVGQLIEMALSLDCTFHDGTAFMEREEIPLSSMTLYNGITGKIMECKVAVGFCYYMALRHQAEEKAFSRSEDTVQVISKQPTEGRAKGGGLRFGEMEKDCLIAHGASEMLLEKLMEDSDPVDVFVCTNKTCVMHGATSSASEDQMCIKCNAIMTKKRIPYSLHLLSQQILMARMKILFEN